MGTGRPGRYGRPKELLYVVFLKFLESTVVGKVGYLSG
jgi:hypothetical protein